MSKRRPKAQQDFSDAARKHAAQCGADLLLEINKSDCNSSHAIAMIRQGAALEVTEAETRYTPLLAACYWGHAEIVRELIAQGADLNARDENHCTPLFVAARIGCVKVVDILLCAGADVNATNRDGWTPLMTAAQSGKEEIVRLLLDRRADTSLRNDDDKTASDHAADEGRYDLAQAIVDEPERRRIAQLKTYMVMEATHLTSVPHLTVPSKKDGIAKRI